MARAQDAPETICMLPGRPVSLLRLLFCGLLVSAFGCNRQEPPGAHEASPIQLVVGAESGSAGSLRSEIQIGSLHDNLPFIPQSLKLASIAWRTWIYTDTGPDRTRLGYLRAGAIVDARAPAIENSGCLGGWYRINPRGFVCVGKGATLDLNHPVVRHQQRRPTRNQAFPYVYAMSGEPPPDRYFRLPSKAQMRAVEGPAVADRALSWLLRARSSGLAERIGLGEPPSFLSSTEPLHKAYGSKNHLRTQLTAGRAGPGSGFALAYTFAWEDRGFGLTTEMDLVALDRLRIAEPQALSGVAMDAQPTAGVAFHVKGALTLWKETARETFAPAAEQTEKRGFALTGRSARGGLLETSEGLWIAKDSVQLLSLRDGFPSVAQGSRKWIDISIRDQTLVAYVGRSPVFATLVSTGRGQMGDPETSFATVRGTFMIFEKSVSSTMDGDSDRADSYELLDVPFVQYFHKGYALHGAYWHDEFGKARSHGCINLSAKDSAWLFEWSDPPVPPGWHAVLNKERGTVVYVRY